MTATGGGQNDEADVGPAAVRRRVDRRKGAGSAGGVRRARERGGFRGTGRPRESRVVHQTTARYSIGRQTCSSAPRTTARRPSLVRISGEATTAAGLQGKHHGSDLQSRDRGWSDDSRSDWQGAAGDPPHIKIRLDGKWEPDQKSFLVWGTLPGATDETIYVIAHRDGWFDAAGDNASGVATMLGLAEYFAKVPQSQRRRTMIFIGTDGHHANSPSGYGSEWLAANREKFFSKTALMINAEHPAEVLTHGGAAQGWTESVIPNQWYAGGASRPQLTKMAADAFHEFGLPIWAQPSPTPPGGDLGPFVGFLPGRRGSVQRLHVHAHDWRHARERPLVGAGGRRPRLCEDRRRGQQAPAERVAATTGTTHPPDRFCELSGVDQGLVGSCARRRL